MRIGVIMSVYFNVKRSDVRGTFLESHFSWQIRTFWFSLLWLLVSGLLFITLIGIPLSWLLLVGVGIWVLYRIIRGWLALLSRQSMPVPD